MVTTRSGRTTAIPSARATAPTLSSAAKVKKRKSDNSHANDPASGSKRTKVSALLNSRGRGSRRARGSDSNRDASAIKYKRSTETLHTVPVAHPIPTPIAEEPEEASVPSPKASPPEQADTTGGTHISGLSSPLHRSTPKFDRCQVDINNILSSPVSSPQPPLRNGFLISHLIQKLKTPSTTSTGKKRKRAPKITTYALDSPSEELGRGGDTFPFLITPSRTQKKRQQLSTREESARKERVASPRKEKDIATYADALEYAGQSLDEDDCVTSEHRLIDDMGLSTMLRGVRSFRVDSSANTSLQSAGSGRALVNQSVEETSGISERARMAVALGPPPAVEPQPAPATPVQEVPVPAHMASLVQPIPGNPLHIGISPFLPASSTPFHPGPRPPVRPGSPVPLDQRCEACGEYAKDWVMGPCGHAVCRWCWWSVWEAVEVDRVLGRRRRRGRWCSVRGCGEEVSVVREVMGGRVFGGFGMAVREGAAGSSRSTPVRMRGTAAGGGGRTTWRRERRWEVWRSNS